MATRFWTGRQVLRVGVVTLTITASNGATFTLTVNSRAVAFVNSANLTATGIASALVTAYAAVVAPEYDGVTISASGAVLTVTGRSDGSPLVASGAATAGAFSTTTTVTATSPNDAADTANYDTFPIAADTLIFPANTPAVYYNLDALAALSLAAVTRQLNGPVIGLPDFRAGGVEENRPRHLQLDCVAITIETTSQDATASVRIKVLATASATVIGIGSATTNNFPIDLTGLGTGGIVRLSKTGAIVGNLFGTACVVATLYAVDSTLFVGPYCAPAAILLYGGTCEVRPNFTTLDVDRAGTATVGATATGTITVNDGTVNWVSSGAIVTATIASNGVLDTSAGSGAIAITNAITIFSGGSLLDVNERITKPYTVKMNRASLGSDGVNVGEHFQFVVQAYS